MVRGACGSGHSPTVARPNYGELDVGVTKQLSKSDQECKKTREHLTLARCRLAHLQSEEARMNIKLKKAELQQQAFDKKRDLLAVKQRDRRRKEALDDLERRDKEEQRNSERERKERARDKMESLYVSRRNEIVRDRESWGKIRAQVETETQHYLDRMSDIKKESLCEKQHRRQRLQDELDSRAVTQAVARTHERRQNEDYLKRRRQLELDSRNETAKEQREAARGVSQAYFETMVKQKKCNVLADAGRKLAVRKQACVDIDQQIGLLEREEMKTRERLDRQKQLLREAATPMYAAPTPRMVRGR